MSSQLTVEFDDGSESKPTVYLHWGGDNVQDATKTLEEFFEAIDGLVDQRLDDASYLAAKLVVYAAWKHQRGGNRLNFLSVGVMDNKQDYGGIRATIDCKKNLGTFTFV